MADTATADTGLLPRTYFKAPRVPLDLRALFLALVGYLVYRLGAHLLALAFDPIDPVATFFHHVLRILDLPYVGREFHRFVNDVFLGGGGGDHGNFWHALAGGVFALGVWGFFAQSVHRITSLRIARDEGLAVKDGIKFAIRNFVTIALCPVIVAIAIGIFFGCNALAGALIAIPFLGEILSLILVPLAVISTLLILLIAIGGAIGLPLVGAAAAWERNGSLDAISRAFSYIFARPLQFFWNYFLILLFTTVILTAGHYFEGILTKSIDAGMWRDQPSVLIDPPETLNNADKDFEKLSPEAKDLAQKLDGETKSRPFAISIKAVGQAPWSDKLTILVFWILLNIIRFGVFAVAIWWFFGATTSTYADLRADVDGTGEDEIYLEEEEEDFEAMAKPEATAAGGAASAGTSGPSSSTSPGSSTTPPPST